MRDILNDLDAGRQPSDPDPVRRAQNQMRAQLPKRFYREAVAGDRDGGFGIFLDGRLARTPGRAGLVLPTEAAAALVAREYAAQGEHIDPITMPVSRIANTAIDGVAQDPQAVLEDILRFSATDLLCYRAGSPDGLVTMQNEAWDPVIDWAHASLGARFILAEGVMHVEQPRETIAAIGAHLRPRSDPFRLAALHVMTSLTGSALLAIAVEAGEIKPAAAWKAAHVDEDWNILQWGEDAEAAQRRAFREAEMMAAAALVKAL